MQAMKRTAVKYAIAIVAVAIAVWGVYSWSRSSVKASDLKFSTVTRGDIETTVSASARIEPSTEEIITSPISSRIIEVYHRPGDVVEAGTPLMKLDIENARTDYEKKLDALAVDRLKLEQLHANIRTKLSDLEMRIKVARMKVKRLEAELAGERYLDSIGSGTTDRVREAEFALNSDVLSLAQLEKQYENEKAVSETEIKVCQLNIEISEREIGLLQRTLTDAEIRSPRRATITEISDKIGSQIASGQQLAVVADLSHYKIVAEAADGYANRISQGCRTHMRLKGYDIDGTIVNIAPTATNGLISFTVRPDCDSLEVMRPGLKGDIHVNSGISKDVLRIDNAPFYNQPGTYSVYVRNGDVIERRNIQLGAANYDYIEVISGLTEGEQIVTNDLSRYQGTKTIKLKQ